MQAVINNDVMVDKLIIKDVQVHIIITYILFLGFFLVFRWSLCLVILLFHVVADLLGYSLSKKRLSEN